MVIKQRYITFYYIVYLDKEEVVPFESKAKRDAYLRHRRHDHLSRRKGFIGELKILIPIIP